ncbi:hypothetical protein L1994_06970 [Methanomicrobium antiquum]|uniref:Uncharacterized protein n=1 Tax=Methanomicrobium antiquum TaxID=487686 RepID=A0AAF0FST5_9EURY|nr:hypothetical protein [Methanomicrobium antiquum]WFN35903.1 hypothetical protein L1994_06970 [Methanomicrobium antiquum]
MDNIEKSLLEKLIWEALTKLYKCDKYLIRHEPILKYLPDELKEYVSERAIVFRFGIYLQELMSANECLKYYHLDCEYNRNVDIIKKMGINAIIPDLIIHKRGSMKNNLLVLEIKTWWNPDNKEDIEKINKLIDPEGEYKYKFGLSIIIEKNYPPNLKWIPEESSEV